LTVPESLFSIFRGDYPKGIAMSSWIYIFSKFTPEALLFEALLIFALTSSYAAFWVLRKRRFGAVENEVPSSVVKVYLNELIGEAEDMRTQLFGLLSGGSARAHHAEGHNGPSFVVSGDAADQLSALEKKMAEQAAAMEKISSEKAKLEKELSEARAHQAANAGGAAGAEAGAGASAGGEDLQKLQEKCQGLEARLAEYSVIEDDLANLKRLQQENAQLKSQLANAGTAATAAVPAPAPAPSSNSPLPPEMEPKLETPVADPAISAAAAAESATTPATNTASDAPSVPADAAASETPASALPPSSSASPTQNPLQPALDAAATTPTFEGLVDEVEKSLQPSTPPAGATPATPAANVTDAKPPKEKSDEDLIAEFEKMLNS
jgi:hypothetical protein